MTSLPAVDLEETRRVTADKFLPGLRLDRLPRAELSLSSVTPDEAAVLSWRWDIDAPTFTSVNVALAIQQAIRMGKKYLFFDVVSIDQTKRGEELGQSVANLATLYSNIPVIAAYDEKNTPSWIKVMRRPWITFEIHAYAFNPTSITYVGHIDGQGISPSLSRRFADVPEAQTSGFQRMFSLVGATSYAQSVLMVLCNQNSMGDVRDLKYMIPTKYANTLARCYSSMNRNDYLLSAAILAQSRSNQPRVNSDLEVMDLAYDLYSFSDIYDAPGYRDTSDIILAGQKIATSYNGEGHSGPRRKFTTEDNAEDIILSSIGVASNARIQLPTPSVESLVERLSSIKTLIPEIQLVFT